MNKLFKKLLITATAILSVICYSTTVAFAAGFDVNNDDSVNVNDVTFLQGKISEFTDNMDYDLNSDGRIDVNDVSFLQIEISNQSVENNTQISISTKEYCKNVGDTFTISVDTNNDVNEITFTSSDSSVAKIISTEKSLAKVKVNKVGNASVTIKQCNKIITTKVKVEKAKCIDISEWNGDINFNKVKSAGITCVILRAGYGKDPNQEDNKFNEYYRQAKAAFRTDNGIYERFVEFVIFCGFLNILAVISRIAEFEQLLFCVVIVIKYKQCKQDRR